jgi:RNA polymerase sigma factor (sigma-70 family)
MYSDDYQAEVAVLVRRCQQGDGRAWAKLVDRFSSLVYSIPRRMRLTEDDCADVFQSTFAQLHKSLDRIEQPETLGKWLSVTASRQALRLIRLNRSRQTVDLEDRSLDEVLADEEAKIDEHVFLSQRAETVRLGMEALKERCRQLLQALYLESEPSYEEISERLGMPIGSIGPTRARCLEKLRSILSKAEFFKSENVSPGHSERSWSSDQ